MKIYFLILLAFVSFKGLQAIGQPANVEKKLTDSICSCLAQLDMSTINAKSEAEAAITGCFFNHMSLMVELAEKRKIDITDQNKMSQLGLEIGTALAKSNCAAFLRLSTKLAANEVKVEALNLTKGNFKRIETREFNYLIVLDEEKNERSFLWLRQFPGSENFINAPDKILGKDVKITWKEIEVYLPKAKGYYKVKEIISVEILK